MGKSTKQVGKDKEDNFRATDNELFEKWNQALNSAQDLVEESYWGGENIRNACFLSTVIPIVVLPNKRLYVAHYDIDGNLVCDPQQVSRCSCFVDRCYQMNNVPPVEYIISHIEIMTSVMSTL